MFFISRFFFFFFLFLQPIKSSSWIEITRINSKFSASLLWTPSSFDLALPIESGYRRFLSLFGWYKCAHASGTCQSAEFFWVRALALKLVLFFFGCMNVLGCLAVVLNLQSARKLVQILCWLERGMKLALPSPPLCNVVQLFDLLLRNIKKTQLSVEGWGWWVWIVPFSEVTHLRTMSIQFVADCWLFPPPPSPHP